MKGLKLEELETGTFYECLLSEKTILVVDEQGFKHGTRGLIFNENELKTINIYDGQLVPISEEKETDQVDIIYMSILQTTCIKYGISVQKLCSVMAQMIAKGKVDIEELRGQLVPLIEGNNQNNI